jgi:FMN-dependent NADH-azoreductase
MAAQATWYWARQRIGRKMLHVIKNTRSGTKENNMKNILLVESSPRGSDSYSHQAARSIVNEVQKRSPGANLVVRDLAANPPPHVGLPFIIGMYAAPEQRTPDQAKSLALSDTLIDELLASDTIVVAVPMHNFGVPSTLKAWIDHISRAGRTFSYGANGPQGLLKGKHAILVLASGGVYSNGQMKAFDFTEPYLRAVLGFLGITNVDVVRVEGVATSAIGPEKALVAASTQSKQLVASLA